MPINSLYHTWFQQIRELRLKQRVTQVRTFVWLLIGIYQSRSVYLSRIAGKIPGRAKLTSATRRLERLLANPALQVRKWYEPIAREWLQAQARHIQQIRLIVDGSKIGFGHQLRCPPVLPFRWSATGSSKRSSCCANWIAGDGIMFYYKFLLLKNLPIPLVQLIVR